MGNDKGLDVFWLGVSFIFLIILITLLVLFVPLPHTVVIGYYEQEAYPAEEIYYEKEPYIITEYYWVEEPYIVDECENKIMIFGTNNVNWRSECIQKECDRHEQYCTEKNFWGNCVRYAERCIHEKCVKYTKYCGLEIENKERQGNTWKLRLMKYDYDDRDSTTISTKELYVPALDKRSIYWTFTYLATDNVNCNWELREAPKIQECKPVTRYHSVQKSRQVTKYKDVKKTRVITQYRKVYKEKKETRYSTLSDRMSGKVVYYEGAV